MKAALLLAALAMLAATASDASVLKSPPQIRTNLIAGGIGGGDRLLHRQYLYRAAIPNTIQSEDLTYRGNATARISAVYATEQAGTQYASAWIVGGGIGRANVTVRAQSYRGYGYYYLVDIYGR